MRQAIILVLDSFGIGATEDAVSFGDDGSNTLGSIARRCVVAAEAGERQGPLALPNLSGLGLMHAAAASAGEIPAGCPLPDQVEAAWGYAKELSSGKDTPSGHWEIAGVPVLFDWGYFTEREHTFPAELLRALIRRADLPGVLGNCHASGTEIIERLGEEHMATGKPIVYTSADSVFQIACHEGSFGLGRLMHLSEIARELVDDYRIGRVIARPFIGESAETFQRTGNRRDLTTPPHEPTVLDKLVEAGGEVVSVGKIADIFAHQGITKKLKASGNDALFDTTLTALADAPEHSIVFTNFVDFDMVFGHRRNALGYAQALERFDARLPELLEAVDEDDLVVLCADHGCDPTWQGSDHTREHIPVLARGAGLTPGSIGERQTFADIGQTLAEYFELPPMDYGESFLERR